MSKTDSTLKILSIDFDYFQKTNKHIMSTCYPDGIDLPTNISSIVWSGYYANPKTADKLKHVNILTHEFETLKQILSSDNNTQPTTPIMIANSHVHIYDFIHKTARTFNAKKINIVNIDMHHDMLNDNSELDCGNWIFHIINDFHRKNINLSWICNPASLDCYDFTENELPNISTTLNDIKNFKFDAIFLCRSDNWLPPHLDVYFHQLIQHIQNRFQNIIIEQDVCEPRNISHLISAQQDVLSKLKMSI